MQVSIVVADSWHLSGCAVEKKIDDQEDFVNWSGTNVRGKGKLRNLAVPAHFVEEAERLTGITKVQASKWWMVRYFSARSASTLQP